MKIVLTRPYNDSIELKKQIEAASSSKCYIQPIMEIVILRKVIEIPDNGVVVLTSVNGARALAQNTSRRKFRIITVGDQSAREAIRLGFSIVESATARGGVSANEANLIKYIKEKVDVKETINHISADVTRGSLKKQLIPAGYRYNRVILYNSKPQEFSYNFIENIREQFFDSYTFFSPRSAALFAKQVFESGLSPFLHGSVAFCFSDNVILGLSGLNFKKIYIPQMTSSENFVNLICDNNI